LGDGPLRAKLVVEAQRLKLQNDVIFMGDRSDVASIMKMAHAVVLPSLQDNQPFIVMEAQVSGKAVVVSDAGGIPEMVTHQETGLIFPKGDSKMLYAHLKTMLDDDYTRTRLVKNAKKWGSDQWSLDKMTSETLQVYDQITGSILSQ
jgi:glycosyltransferase involved in cell wall biosynthesis